MAALGRVAQLGAWAASPTDAPNPIRPSRVAIPFPSINKTAQPSAARTKKEQCTTSVSWQRPPHNSQDGDTPIGSLQFHMLCQNGVARVSVAGQSHSFF